MAAGASPFGSLATPPGQAPVSEPLGGNMTTLDKFIASMQNLTGAQGQGILGAGLNLTASGTPFVNAGTNVAGAGLTQAGSGVAAAAPALDYLTKLVRGDQADVAAAAQPQIDEISQQFDQIRNLVSLQPRGGGKASVLAESPFQKTKAIADVEGQMRTGAAGQLGALSQQIASTGLGEAGVGLGIGQLGLGEQGVGLSLAGLGTGLESTAINAALGKQALNYGQPSALSQLESAVSTFI